MDSVTQRPFLPALSGPTGCGKSELALRLAERLGREVISADSRQIYRGLAVATAAPDAGMLTRVIHHLVGSHEPSDTVSAGDFCRTVRSLLAEGRPCLMAGGSLFYIQAWRSPVDESVGVDEELRLRVRALFEEQGAEAFRETLLQHDPEAAWIDRRDSAKLRRYMEISMGTGRPASEALRELRRDCPARTPLFVIQPELAELTPRLKRRLKQMLSGGMIEEVEALLNAGVDPAGHALSSVGAPEIALHLRGEITRESLEEKIYRRTRQYAKKQLTWIRKLVRQGEAEALPKGPLEGQEAWLLQRFEQEGGRA